MKLENKETQTNTNDYDDLRMYMEQRMNSHSQLDYEKKLIFEMKKYINCLGYLDAFIAKERNNINFFETHDYLIFDSVEYKESLRNHKYYLIKRKELVQLINAETMITAQFTFIKNILESIPAYEKFGLLYKDIINTHYNLKLQSEFIKFYTEGFNNGTTEKGNNLKEKLEEYYEQLGFTPNNNIEKDVKVKVI